MLDQKLIRENPSSVEKNLSLRGKIYKISHIHELTVRKKLESINAIKKNHIHEIESSIILQPGPASLFDGMKILHDIFKNWSLKC